MFGAILTFTVRIVPVSTVFLCAGNSSVGIHGLENNASTIRIQRSGWLLISINLLQYALPLHFEHSRNFTPGVVWSLPQVLQRRRLSIGKKMGWKNTATFRTPVPRRDDLQLHMHSGGYFHLDLFVEMSQKARQIPRVQDGVAFPGCTGMHGSRWDYNGVCLLVFGLHVEKIWTR